MKAEQFIEFANDFAKASAKTSSAEIQQAYVDNLDCLARPGDQVVVIKKPWPTAAGAKSLHFANSIPAISAWKLKLMESKFRFQRMPSPDG